MSHSNCCQWFFNDVDVTKVRRVRESLIGPCSLMPMPFINTEAKWRQWRSVFPTLPECPSRTISTDLFGTRARCTLTVSRSKISPDDCQPCESHNENSTLMYTLYYDNTLFCKVEYYQHTVTLVYLKFMEEYNNRDTSSSSSSVTKKEVRFKEDEPLITLADLLTLNNFFLEEKEVYTSDDEAYEKYDPEINWKIEEEPDVPYDPETSVRWFR